MKNIVTVSTFIIVFAIWGTQETKAQYRQYSDCDIRGMLGVDEGGSQLDLYNVRTTYKSPKCDRGDEVSGSDEKNPFEFDIPFYDINVLLQMEAAMAAAYRAAVEAWLRKQEDVFRKEINKQLNTDHNNFRDAQKDFFKNYEENIRGVTREANKIARRHSFKSLALDKEQEQFTYELYLIKQWREGLANAPASNVRGIELGSASISELDQLWNDVLLKDFYKKEYESAKNRSWAQGLYKIVDDGSLLSGMVDNHIAYYNQSGLDDKIFLMTTYLSIYYNLGGPMTTPTAQYRIPNFWDDRTLLEMGKKRNPFDPDLEILVLGPTFIPLWVYNCEVSDFDAGDCDRAEMESIRDRVIQEHINGLDLDEEDGLVLDEEIIRDRSFQEIDKINCTYDQLEKTETIKKLLKDFFGDDAEFDLVFKVVENLDCNDADDPNGCTRATDNFADKKVDILIDKGYINSAETPTLFLARTLLHEAVHANLFLAVKKLNGGVTPTDSEFGTLYEQYRQKREWQHEFMADRYVGLIAEGLKEVHPLLGDARFIADRNDSFPDWNWNDFYNELAWLGLYDTTTGQEHLQNSNYITDSNLYVKDTETDSTKDPKCN